MRQRFKGVLTAGAAASALMAGAAMAQPAGQGPAMIEEVVVTAQRREESLQNVPISVTAVTAAALERRGVQSTEDLATTVPGMTVLSTAGFLQPRIRGVGNNVVGAGYEGGVSTYVDGVYIASAPATIFSLNNVERIEVLKGPQGTLFGRNATGGLIHIITRAPSRTFGGKVAGTVAKYRTYTFDGYVTGGLTDSIAADFAAHVSTQQDGYGVNLVTGQDVNLVDRDVNLRSSVLFTPSDATSIRVTADYEHTKGSMSSATRLAPGTGAPLPYIDPGQPWNIAQDIQPFNQLTAGGLSARLDQDLGFANLVGIAAYRASKYRVNFDGDVTSTPGVNPDVHTRDRQFTGELQLTSNETSRLNWVLGVFYLDANAKYEPSRARLLGALQPVTPFGRIAVIDTFAELPTRSWAGYGQVTFPLIGDSTKLTLGGRYTYEEHELTAHQDTQLSNGVSLSRIAFPDQSKDFSAPTWRVSLDHRFSPGFMAYASYNRGFKSGGYNGQFPTDPAFLPETLDAYEVGFKSDLLDRRLRINGAAFWYDYTDIQVARFVGNQISYYNGASARVYGADVEFEARVTAALTVTGGFTVLHDRFESFPNAIISRQVPTGIIVSIGSAEGNRLPMTPDYSWNIAADYQRDLGFATLGLDGSYSYNDGYFSQPDNILRQPSFEMVAAGVQLTFPNDVSVRLWGRNLTNAKVAATLAAGTFDSNISYQPPRTYGVTLEAKF